MNPRAGEETSLKGRRAIITGAVSGIGAACAVALAQAGADVSVSYWRGGEAGRQTCTAVEQPGATAFAVAVDVRDEMSLEAAFDATAKRFGHADILINSPGLNQSSVASLVSPADGYITGAILTTDRGLSLVLGQGA